MEMKGTKVAVDFGKTVEQKKRGEELKLQAAFMGPPNLPKNPADSFRPLEYYNEMENCDAKSEHV